MSDIIAFAKQYVDAAPAERGVYALYQDAELIYIGRAHGFSVTIRTRLQCHLRGDEGWCTQQATHYWRQVCDDPAMTEAQLLEWHRTKFGRLPRCNERQP